MLLQVTGKKIGRVIPVPVPAPSAALASAGGGNMFQTKV
jgi:hypothetical protein